MLWLLEAWTLRGRVEKNGFDLDHVGLLVELYMFDLKFCRFITTKIS
jgi:hypothetical protein